MRNALVRPLAILSCCVCWSACHGGALRHPQPPTIFFASDTVAPGEALGITGAGFAAGSEIEV